MSKLWIFVYLVLFIKNIRGPPCPVNNTILITCQPGKTLYDDSDNVVLDYKVSSVRPLEEEDKSLNGTSYFCRKTTVDQYFYKYMLMNLGKEYRVSGVYLNGYSNHGLDDVELYLGKAPGILAMYFVNVNRIPGDCTVVFDPPIHSRYVKFHKRGNDTLELCGLTVYGVN